MQEGMHVIGVGWGNQIKANGSHIKGIFILKAYWSDALHDIVFVMENIGMASNNMQSMA